MDRGKLKWITWGFAVATVLIVALMLTQTLKRTTHVTLPPPAADLSGEESGSETGRDTLAVVEVTPNTVQSAIATLSRPVDYIRTVTLEQFWEGGSGEWAVTVFALDGWQRTDRLMPDHRLRHTATDGETTYIWYNTEETVFSAPAGSITADHDQNIPTYEDILALDAQEIITADYRMLEGVRCIYVETAEQESGYALRYWVGVDSGLLVGSEKVFHGETVYRMTALSLDVALPQAGDFLLPDGTDLLA